METKTVLKMKNSIYKTGLLLITALFLFSVTITAQEVTKDFHKEFSAPAGTALDLSNRYGNITVETWNQDQIVIDVKVTVEMPDRDRAERLLNYIDVQFDEGDNVVSAKTIIDEKFNFSGWGSGSRKFSIVYKVKMPVDSDLKLTNRYGNTDLMELQGMVNLDIKYGNLIADKLTRGNVKPLSRISLAYGKADIEEAGWLDLYIRYSPEMMISRSQALLLDSKYSKIRIEETSSLVGESRYDNVRIGNINNLVIENGYDDVNIEMLSKKLDFTGSYGSFTVERVAEGFESLNVDSRYTGVRLGIAESASYELDAKVTYGGLKLDEDNFKYQRRIVENNSNEMAGVVGKEENPSARVRVQSSYGTVRLF
jgi:hypothetical protein